MLKKIIILVISIFVVSAFVTTEDSNALGTIWLGYGYGPNNPLSVKAEFDVLVLDVHAELGFASFDPAVLGWGLGVGWNIPEPIPVVDFGLLFDLGIAGNLVTPAFLARVQAKLPVLLKFEGALGLRLVSIGTSTRVDFAANLGIGFGF